MKFSSKRNGMDTKGQISTLEYVDVFSFFLLGTIHNYSRSQFGPKGTSCVNRNGKLPKKKKNLQIIEMP